MNRKIIGALLLFIISLAAIFLIWFFLPVFTEKFQKTTSDATKTKGKIHIAMDNWIGYFPLRSPEMIALMRRSGWILVCEDDNADYAARMERLKNGDIDFAVATVDSFILNAYNLNFPGVIIGVIDESKGGDAILANKSKVESLVDLKGKTGIHVAFTPSSPSHHLAKAAADHFNVSELLPQGKLRIETDGSQAAREKLTSGKADIAILWEPDVSKALRHDGIVKLLGTEDTERLIVDILVVSRSFAKKNPDVVLHVMNNYFRALKTYKESPDLLKKHVKAETGLLDDEIESMLKGVTWVNFNENCEKWFGIAAPGTFADEGLVSTISSTAKILQHAKDFNELPIPDDDPYRLTNSSYLETLFQKGISGFTSPGAGSRPVEIDSLEAKFSALSAREWDQLKEVGTLKVDPIVFQQGADTLSLLSKQVIDQAVERLRHYPNFRVNIVGHTGTRGDRDENIKLSLNRARAVQRYLTLVYSIDKNRLRVTGMGGDAPLPQLAGESKRSYEYRLPRVELVLMREDF
ncbi:phosphate ABC transporter substrate-binding/OmpA family protein [uncultured Desulfobacter sp.]|uniref:phosphate ABC transporter substrate-binding/OmpA family protein n=1 Tax=uncultured Desulfobacter sp. TaxID=240139 RepID=UPI002AABB3FA|nr:phosphate ABC transporter substrate-binding/OmpA family protein [uncultured Desulfobacter sp.]